MQKDTTGKIRKNEFNIIENMAYQNVWDAAKTMLKRKVNALNSNI